MNNKNTMQRSGELMSAADSALLVVDVQEKFLPVIRDAKKMVWNIRRLLDGAKACGVAVGATEQYPQGLGGTVAELAERLPNIPEKLSFSCRECDDLFHAWGAEGRFKILVVGIEAHVCVQQTVLDLLTDGFRVYLATDAISSRHRQDAEVALRRMESSGAVPTTTEAALFEWCDTAAAPFFKTISALARENPPQAE